MRRVYILPNLFTAGSLFCGLLAIFEVFDQGDVLTAVQFVLLAGVLDVLDGLIARLTRAQTPFGLQFDSLSDAISFGAAPATIIYSGIAGEDPLLAKATCGLYVVCGALRLARFNVQAQKEEKRSFLGLPIPGAACGILSLFLMLSKHEAIDAIFPVEKIMPLALAVVAWLMVSKYQYYGLKSVDIKRRQPFEILVSIVIVLSLLVALKQHLDFVFLIVFGSYTLSGPAIYHYLEYRRVRLPGGANPHAVKESSRLTGKSPSVRNQANPSEPHAR